MGKSKKIMWKCLYRDVSTFSKNGQIQSIYSGFIWPDLPPVTGGIPNPNMALFSPILCNFSPNTMKKVFIFFPYVKAQAASQKLR